MLFDDIIGFYFSNGFLIAIAMIAPVLVYLLYGYNKSNKKIDGNEIFFIISVVASVVIVYIAIEITIIGIYCGFTQSWPQVIPPQNLAILLVILGVVFTVYMCIQIRDRVKERLLEEKGTPEKLASRDLNLPRLTTNQMNILKIVCDLSNRNLITPVGFNRICDQIKSLNKEVVASELQYLEEKGYINHKGFHYNVTSLGLDYISVNT
jgi:hypothetical protein